MKQGKHKMEKVKIIDRYLVLVIIAILLIGIAYAQIADKELTVSGNLESEVQEGVFISQVTYKSNVGADTANSAINYYLGTMMDSKVVLGSSSNSTITYDVTVYNNTDKEQIFIKTITDDTDEILYSNTNIGYSVSLEDYVTTIAPKQSLTFTITFAYNGTDTSNPILNSKLNFRFREKPVIELSNEGQIYTLENIYAGSETEYEFTVKNNNATYTNGVPMIYGFVTTMTEGSPLTAEIYDASGNKVTGEITLAGDETKVEQAYTLKLIWDSSKNGSEYKGQEYQCNVALIAQPKDAKYLDYTIEKEFNVDITTLGSIPISTVEQLLKIATNEKVIINNKTYTFSADANYQLQNDLVFSVADYLALYPNAFEEVTYTETTTETLTNQVTNYATANSTSDPYYTYTAPATGTYKLEVWGANGGSYSSYTTGGTGGYSIGTINLQKGEELYVYVGGKGTTDEGYSMTEGYNGGGPAFNRGGSGGGASDIRINGTTYYDRVIVAGGGGGATWASDETIIGNGGNGGGLTGRAGSGSVGYMGLGGTQTSGGSGGYSSSGGTAGLDGSFGSGAQGSGYISANSVLSGAGRGWLVWRRFGRLLQR